MDYLQELLKQIGEHASEREIKITMEAAVYIANDLDTLRRIRDVLNPDRRDY